MKVDLDIATIQGLIPECDPSNSPTQIAALVGEKLRTFGKPLLETQIAPALADIAKETQESIVRYQAQLSLNGSPFSGAYYSFMAEARARQVLQTAALLKSALISRAKKKEILESSISTISDAIHRELNRFADQPAIENEVMRIFEFTVGPIRSAPDLWADSEPPDDVTGPTLAERKFLRFSIMKALYERTRGSKQWSVPLNEIAIATGANEADTRIEADYLSDEGLVEIEGGWSFLCITHAGVKEVEAALEHPESPTEHFIAVKSAAMVSANFSNATIGALTIAGGRASFSGTLNQALGTPLFQREPTIRDSLLALIDSVEKSALLDPEKKAELLQQVGALIDQANLPKEKRSRGVIKAVSNTIASTIQTTAALSELWAQHGDKIRQLLEIIT